MNKFLIYRNKNLSVFMIEGETCTPEQQIINRINNGEKFFTYKGTNKTKVEIIEGHLKTKKNETEYDNLGYLEVKCL